MCRWETTHSLVFDSIWMTSWVSTWAWWWNQLTTSRWTLTWLAAAAAALSYSGDVSVSLTRVGSSGTRSSTLSHSCLCKMISLCNFFAQFEVLVCQIEPVGWLGGWRINFSGCTNDRNFEAWSFGVAQTVNIRRWMCVCLVSCVKCSCRCENAVDSVTAAPSPTLTSVVNS